MTELAALNIKITGDSGDLQAALRTANDGLESLGRVTTAAEAKLTQLDKSVVRSANALTDMQRKINGVTGVMDQLPKSAAASASAFAQFDRMAAGVGNLRASFDPLYAASKKYESAVEQLDAALAAGAINQAQYNRVLAQAQNAYLGPSRGVEQMGGALSGLATRMHGARGAIQNVSYQLQDVAVQFQMGTNAAVIFSQQGSQIASAFGPVGAAFGAVLAVAPLLAVAFMDNANNASALTSAMDELTAATEAFRISTQAIRLGVDEREVLIVEELARAVAKVTAEEQRLAANRGTQAAVDAAKAEVALIQSRLDGYRQMRGEELALKTAKDLSKQASDQMLAVMRQLANSNISGPWETVLGAIQAAIEKAGEYARASGFGMTTGNADFAKGRMGFTLPGAELIPPETPSAGGGGGGGAAVNPIQTQLEALQQGLMTQEQLQLESYTRQQETLKQALRARLVSQQEYANLMEQVEATHQAKMGSQMREGVATTIGALSQLFNKSKPLAIASALVNTWQGMTEALKLPFPKNIAAAATTLATGMNAVRNIRSTSPGGGGSTSGSIGAGGASAVAASAPQQNVQTLNFTLTNDSFGIGQNLVRQIASQLNEATRNGNTLIRATVS